jgi:hypothetical protein
MDALSSDASSASAAVVVTSSRLDSSTNRCAFSSYRCSFFHAACISVPIAEGGA